VRGPLVSQGRLALPTGGGARFCAWCHAGQHGHGSGGVCARARPNFLSNTSSGLLYCALAARHIRTQYTFNRNPKHTQDISEGSSTHRQNMFNTAEALPAQVNIHYSIDIPTKKRVAWGGAASPEESGACGGVHLYLLSGPWVFLR
jgi:hypothetical protein